MRHVNEFKYHIDHSELKVNDIFVKYYNQDIFYRPKDVNGFVVALINQLKEEIENKNGLEELTL